MNDYGIVLFFTTSAVMRAEKLLTVQGLPTKLTTVPRQFSSDCGIAVRFEWKDHAKVESTLLNSSVEIQGIHHLEDD